MDDVDADGFRDIRVAVPLHDGDPYVIDAVFCYDETVSTKTSKIYKPLACPGVTCSSHDMPGDCADFEVRETGSTTDEDFADRTFYFKWLKPGGAQYQYRGTIGGVRGGSFEGWEMLTDLITAVYFLGGLGLGHLIRRMILDVIFPTGADA